MPDINIAPAVASIMQITDADGYELGGNVTVTVSEPVVDYYLEAAGIERRGTDGYFSNGERVTWMRDEAFVLALAIVATYR